jgi:hypothetical protein
MARAAELLDLVASPTAVVTGVLLTFARNQLARNAAQVDRAMTCWALLASIAGLVTAAGVVAVMSPLAWKVVMVNRGGVETRLLVYLVTFALAIGTSLYAAFIARTCARDIAAS